MENTFRPNRHSRCCLIRVYAVPCRLASNQADILVINKFIKRTHRIAAAADTCHAYLKDIGRAEYVPVTDEEAVQAFEYIAREEGIIAAIESSHAKEYSGMPEIPAEFLSFHG